MKQNKKLSNKTIANAKRRAKKLTVDELKTEIKIYQDCLQNMSTGFREADEDLPGWGLIQLYQTGIAVCENELKARKL